VTSMAELHTALLAHRLELPGTSRHAALAAGASFSHRAQGGGMWPGGAGMPDPQPQAPPPTNSAPEPAIGRQS
jgi:hypothetical protein